MVPKITKRTYTPRGLTLEIDIGGEKLYVVKSERKNEDGEVVTYSDFYDRTDKNLFNCLSKQWKELIEDIVNKELSTSFVF